MCDRFEKTGEPYFVRSLISSNSRRLRGFGPVGLGFFGRVKTTVVGLMGTFPINPPPIQLLQLIQELQF